ncbi:MAG TPA: HPP family protein [Firmicutes bacterium]|jgi:CBS-domain-containing membrane protein|nr:HPP family protein [Bacillota bacterium]
MNDIKPEKKIKKVKVEKTFLQKCAGQTRCKAVVPGAGYLLVSFLGSMGAILAIAYLCIEARLFAFIVPFGASSVLVFGDHLSEFSQPRNLVAGHVLSAFVGVAVLNVLGFTCISLALAVGLSTVVMLITRTMHPPAGATSLLGVISSNGSYLWPIIPIASGALIIVLIALLVNNLDKRRSYPLYWY